MLLSTSSRWLYILALALTLCLYLSQSNTQTNTETNNNINHDRAVDLHDTAIDLANKGEYEQCLAYFRAAVRATNNSNPWYLSDLGVTEMRMGFFALAHKRFKRALFLDENLQIAEENLKELAKFTSMNELRYHTTPHEQQHTLRQPLVVSASSLFQLDMMMNIDPSVFKDTRTYFDDVFVVRDFFSIYGLNADVFGPHLLVRNYGETLVDYYPQNLLVENDKPFFAKMTKAITHLTQPEDVYTHVDVSEAGTYIQWNINDQNWRKLMKDSAAFLPNFMNDNRWLDKCMLEQEVL
jgi:tetratricopeptide (TPR) repeat protein